MSIQAGQFVGSDMTGAGDGSRRWLALAVLLAGGKIVRASAFFDAIEFDNLWRRVAAAVE